MLRTILYTLCLAAMLSNSEASQPQPLQIPSNLAPLVSAEGNDYIRLRDELIAGSSVDWRVDAASETSWELGVLVFVLNNRRTSTQEFVVWDAYEPDGMNIRGRWYRLRTGSVDARIAFLLEKVLKPIVNNDRKYALNDIDCIIGNGCCRFDNPNVPMWRAIWERCPISELRKLALLAIASSSDPSVLDIITDVLRDHEHPEAFSVRALCLGALTRSTLSEVGDLVLNEWEHLKAMSLDNHALGVLCGNPNSRARQFVRSLALDANNPDGMRKNIVAWCSNRRFPGDREFLERFLRKCESLKLRRMVVRDLGTEYPLEWIRGPLRDILLSVSDTELVQNAALAISQAITTNTKLRTQDVVGDLKMLDQAANRKDLNELARASMLFGLHNLRERLATRD